MARSRRRCAAPGGWRFVSLLDFFNKYQVPQLMAHPDLSRDTEPVSYPRPERVVPWHEFNQLCSDILSSPVVTQQRVFEVPRGIVERGTCMSEAEVVLQLYQGLFAPFRLACEAVGIHIQARITRGRFLQGINGSPDVCMESSSLGQLLFPIEVKTSKVLCLEDGDLVQAYETAEENGRVKDIITQVFMYVEKVPYGVLITDQQLFCVFRKDTTLYVSAGMLVGASLCCEHTRFVRGRPRQSRQGDAGAHDRSTPQGGLTAPAALYCMAELAQTWWDSSRASSGGDHGGRGGDGSGFGGWEGIGSNPDSNTASTRGGRHVTEPLDHPASYNGIGNIGTPDKPTEVTESSYTSRDVFGETDPRVNPLCCIGHGCSGFVLEGRIRGQPAAIKVADLSKRPEAREVFRREAAVYARLQALQGVCVPRLLAYGYLSGGSYFLATSLEGPSLSQAEAWPADQAAEDAIIASAVNALDQVHAAGVVHGDIALRNLVFSRRRISGSSKATAHRGSDGDSVRAAGVSPASGAAPARSLAPVLLVDFGLSRLMSTTEARTPGAPAAAGHADMLEQDEAALLMAQERQLLLDELGVQPGEAAAGEETAAGGDVNGGRGAAYSCAACCNAHGESRFGSGGVHTPFTHNRVRTGQALHLRSSAVSSAAAGAFTGRSRCSAAERGRALRGQQLLRAGPAARAFPVAGLMRMRGVIGHKGAAGASRVVAIRL